ncbi:MAG: Hsp20/alpha crystallin family protein [Bifidobacteriaceae bacterium]|jgi:HSP20 family molecular chaperone IbpA|nr:Hsp20/alpha crystallin family protein [Bifidobacteriaceae bacterium]
MAMLPALFDDTVMNDVFSDPFFTQAAPGGFAQVLAPNTMSTDIKETDHGYDLTIDMPGFTKSDISVNVDGGYLTVSAARSQQHEDHGGNGEGKGNDAQTHDEKNNAAATDTYLRRERYVGSCSRSYYVGDGITNKDVTARYENGTLRVSVPKMDQASVTAADRVQIEG